MKRSIKIFVLLLAAKSFVWSGSFNAIEFVELLKKIAIPEKAEYTNHGQRFLAEPGTVVEWETVGVNPEMRFPPVTGGLGGIGRTGHVYIHFDGKSMTNVLEKVVEESPWNISWSGTFHLVNGVYLGAGVDAEDYINIPKFLEKKKLAKGVDIPETSGVECYSRWFEIRIPSYKPMWMNVIEDCGNRFCVIQIAFVFEKSDRSYACRRYEDM